MERAATQIYQMSRNLALINSHDGRNCAVRYYWSPSLHIQMLFWGMLLAVRGDNFALDVIALAEVDLVTEFCN